MRKAQNPVEYWESVYRTKDQLRQALRIHEVGKPHGTLMVHGERRTGKTTALVQHVGERTLALSTPKERIVVLCPNESICAHFQHFYETHFPLLRQPLIATLTKNPEFAVAELRGHEVVEIYAEEIFMMTPHAVHTIREQFPFIAGVGTLYGPTLITCESW